MKIRSRREEKPSLENSLDNHCFGEDLGPLRISPRAKSNCQSVLTST
jgi:hypothetical protein